MTYQRAVAGDVHGEDRQLVSVEGALELQAVHEVNLRTSRFVLGITKPTFL